MEPGSKRPADEAGHHEPSVDILIWDGAWRRIPGAERAARRAAAIAGRSLTVVLASDREVKRLNHRHRGRNKPTNVLSFPPGEIILARGVLGREARAAGRPPAHHLAHLVLHGALHCGGHDHHRPGEARRMEMTEARLLSRMRIPNPWKPGRVPP